MRCPVCRDAEIEFAFRDICCGEGLAAMTVRDVLGEWCPACGEGVFGLGESGRISATMLAVRHRVTERTLDHGFIRRTRKKLRLGQRQAGVIFGGGRNAFSRYENGSTKPPLALIKLLVLLDRHPELFKEIRADLYYGG